MVEPRIARLLDALTNDLGRSGFQIARPSQPGEQVYDRGGRVDAYVSKLGVPVVERKRVMIIMPTLARSIQRQQPVVYRARGLVVRFHAPRVTQTVDDAESVQRVRVA